MPARKSAAPTAQPGKAAKTAKTAAGGLSTAPAAPDNAATRQAQAMRDGAAAAARPHLTLMAQTAARGTDTGAAGLGLLMLWLADDVEHRANASLAPFGVSESKLDVLMIFGLAERGLIDSRAVTPSYIADYFGVTRSTVTGLLDWLEKRELLTRALNQDDRRSISLTLTDAGRDLLARALPAFWTMCASLVDCLDEADRTALQGILAKVWKHLKRAPA
ncbi:MarR family winged helix-turn-helix transcriptional regulator [Achromobacter insuavis]|uniref:MarR family winged helix-turn-helix transcriptional regulator n=1 Tax=Achromobacter insuavis TaxID=1287735 RepID=UPI000A6DC446|nr:MarR family transcriptional regulator [Achromobacter insuavis]